MHNQGAAKIVTYQDNKDDKPWLKDEEVQGVIDWAKDKQISGADAVKKMRAKYKISTKNAELIEKGVL